MVAPELLARAIAEHPTIGADQEALVRDFLRGDGVVCGIGPAGTGKTFAMKVLSRACQLGAVPVFGLTPTGEAADMLRAETGMPAETIDAFLLRLSGSRPLEIPRGAVLIVDEAGMVSTKNLVALQRWAKDAGVFVRPVGDHAQYSSVEAGGGFHGLCLRLGATALTENRRQKTDLGKKVAALVRTGRREDHERALELLREHGKLKVYRTQEQTGQALVADFFHAYTRGGNLTPGERGASVGMVTDQRAAADRLNIAAHDAARETGLLGERALPVNGIEIAEGDLVRCGRNHRQLQVKNGTRGIVRTIDPETSTVIIELDDGTTRRLPEWYVKGQERHGRRWLDLGYAGTGQKYQGRSLEATFELPGRGHSRQAAYTAATRHTHDRAIYTWELEQVGDPSELAQLRRAVTDPMAKLRAAAGRDDAQHLVQDLAERDLAPLSDEQVRGLPLDRLRTVAEQLAARHGPEPADRTEQLAEARARREAAERTHAQARQRLHALEEDAAKRRWRRRTETPEQAIARQGVAAARRRLASAADVEQELRRHQGERQAWKRRYAPVLEQEALVAAELDWRARATARALAAERPVYLMRLLGEVPHDRAGRRRLGGAGRVDRADPPAARDHRPRPRVWPAATG